METKKEMDSKTTIVGNINISLTSENNYPDII